MMIDLYFRPSDKVRDLSRNTVLFSSLTLFFSIYQIPITAFPFLSLNLDTKSAEAVFKNINVTSVLLIVALFYFVQMCLLGFTEYADWQRQKELALYKDASENKVSVAAASIRLDSASQQALNNAQSALNNLNKCNSALGFGRILFELIFPAVLTGAGVWLAGRNLWAFIRVTILSAIV